MASPWLLKIRVGGDIYEPYYLQILASSVLEDKTQSTNHANLCSCELLGKFYSQVLSLYDISKPWKKDVS